MKERIRRYLLLIAMAATASSAFGSGAEITKVDASADGDTMHIEVDLSAPITPKVTPVNNPDRLILDFPGASLGGQLQYILVNKNGVKRIRVGLNQADPPLTRVIVDLESLRPYGVEVSGNKVVLSVLPLPAAIPSMDSKENEGVTLPKAAPTVVTAPPAASLPKVENLAASTGTELTQTKSSPAVRGSFRIKYIAGNTAYIDGGSNSGLQEGMNLVIRDPHPLPVNGDRHNNSIATLRVIAVATTSAVTEVRDSIGKVKIGDRADLAPGDAAMAAEKVLTGSVKTPHAALMSSKTAPPPGEQPEIVERSRASGRIGFDYSGISSGGSTPGASLQLGMSFQSDMTHILGTHWNLQGYWRGRINRHSQFQQATIEDTLNKTYTMQLFYDNPDSKWVAGFGRLYLPWAVSLDTIDGGYLGRKVVSGVTTGVFAGSTPDLASWNYQPNHRIAGSFINFEGGGYERLHYTSTSGLALSTVGWKLDRPYLFFENEISYKSLLSVYHSLIADSPRGVSTDGIRPGAGISHSYLTVHFQPQHRLSFDIYHNYFRDVPTAATAIVGTGLVDKLLFQGVNGGVHFQPVRNVTLYTSIGASEKTGDTHRSLNEMYGGSWSEIAHSGVRADFHYSKFDSNFGQGNYRVLSFSRQMSDRMFWNLQLGNQNLLSALTANNHSNFIANSLDINMGKHSYLQSGYTLVNGSSLNYRQWYLSWGFRFDKKQTDVEFVQTPEPKH
jgi:hypothetical protein